MTSTFAWPSSLPFFLPVPDGQRFCIYHAPPADIGIHSAVLYAHPFGEEMNRSRRVASLQARALAAIGVAVLQIDLHGCGDSSGDFAEARWQNWIDDLMQAHEWLADQTKVAVNLWGLRLGALLMLDYARQATAPVERLILWQPVTNGHAWLTQWLRLRLARQLFDTQAGGDQAGSTLALRATLASGASLEVAGYELAPELAASIDAAQAAALVPTGHAVDWFDIAANVDRPMTPANVKIIADWQQQGVRVSAHQVVGQPFWSLPEIVSCPALVTATLGTFAGHHPVST